MEGEGRARIKARTTGSNMALDFIWMDSFHVALSSWSGCPLRVKIKIVWGIFGNLSNGTLTDGVSGKEAAGNSFLV
jgi:hypothetical protein